MVRSYSEVGDGGDVLAVVLSKPAVTSSLRVERSTSTLKLNTKNNTFLPMLRVLEALAMVAVVATLLSTAATSMLYHISGRQPSVAAEKALAATSTSLAELYMPTLPAYKVVRASVVV